MQTDTGKIVSRTDVSTRYSCPLCGADVGRPCMGWSRKETAFTGRPRTALHLERWQQYPGILTR